MSNIINLEENKDWQDKLSWDEIFNEATEEEIADSILIDRFLRGDISSDPLEARRQTVLYEQMLDVFRN